MLKPSLQIRIGQQLAMTPQLQQAIRLLQLSSLELQAEIQENFESNPLLDQEEDTPESEPSADTRDSNESSEQPTSQDNSETEVRADQEYMSEDLPVDSNWDDIYQTSGNYSEASNEPVRDIYETESAAEHSLAEHLLWQLDMMTLSDTDRVIGIALIDEIDQDGYLQVSVESIYEELKETFADLDLDEVEAVLTLVQRLDPIGSGARNLGECLDIQLQQLSEDTPFRDTARKLVQHHIDALGSHNNKLLCRSLSISDQELKEVIALIQSLQPRPGSQISSGKPEYVVPDVSVTKKEGRWRVELNAEVVPKLRINQTYADLIKRADNSADNQYLKGQLQEARWFIKSLQSRNETLLRVATSIVEHQRRFLDYGEEAMKPLVLRDVAEQLEMHESTVSRVTTNKYMHTPRGIYEFKYFFSSHVGTSDGGICSSTAIRAMIKKLIDGENQAKPLSDSKIAELLSAKGINVARRTVAKYREAMSIPPSNERKQLSG